MGTETGEPRGRLTAVLLALSLLAGACGARLEPGVRDQAVSAMVSGATRTVATAVEGDAPGTSPDALGSTDLSADVASGTVVGSPTLGATSTSSNGVASSGDGSSAPAGGDSADAPAGTATGAAPTNDTRSMPAGGNGGATAVGVFEDRIVIGNGVDNSGAVPGIFIDAQLATQAFVAWFTATEGTIYGRRLELMPRDTRLDAGANREVYLEFCEKAFAGVGSMSAFDEGIAGPVADCGLPDIRSATVNGRAMAVPTVFSSDAISIDFYPTNHYLYWDGAYPGAKDAAAILYVDNDTTRNQTRLMKSVATKVGYNFIVDRAIGLAETNYSTYVIELKDKGVTFVEFQGDAPQAVRLAKAMRQQNYWPTVFGLQQNLYKPALIQQGGADIEGVELALGSVMNENIQHHPELQTYRQWLKQIDPEAEPTGQGAYSWGAGLLFVQLVKQIGPDLTREKLVAALKQVHDFDGNGLFPPQDVGRKLPTNCHIMAKVEGGRFVPTSPGNGRTFECRGKVEAA